jgi:DUF4097 and DUF4098 domain-containing protein YvlB
MTRSSHRFPAAGPVTLDVRLHGGSITVTAADTDETAVEITGRQADEAFRVDSSGDGRRVVVEPVGHRFHRHRHDIAVRLPAGSEVHLAAAAGLLTVEGRVAAATVSCASGRIRIDEVDGRADVSSASGTVELGTVRGAVDVRTASGAVEVGRAGGECTLRSASGQLTVGVADAGVTARSASGSIRVREAHRGTVDLHSTSGSVAVGVRQGTLVWLDVVSTAGRVESDLAADEPGTAEGSPLTVRARTVSGSVSITSAGPTAIAL